jgi:hypothetical protein
MNDRSASLSSAYRTQLAIIAVLVTVFYVFTVSSVPKGKPNLLSSATIVFLASAFVSRRLGYGAKSGVEMLGVFFVSALALFMPLAATAPIAGEAAVAAGLGLICAEALWAIHRYPADRRAEQVSSGTFIKYSLVVFAGFVLLLAVWLFVFVLTHPTKAASLGREFLWVVPSLVLAGLFVGIVLGRMRALARYPLGAMLIGFIVAAITIAALATPAYVLFGTIGAQETTFAELVVDYVGWSLMVGPPAAVAFKWSEQSRGWNTI